MSTSRVAHLELGQSPEWFARSGPLVVSAPGVPVRETPARSMENQSQRPLVVSGLNPPPPWH